MWAKRKGFTIVELLIVIAVIAVLAAVTIIGYNTVQSNAQETSVGNDLKNMAKQMELFKLDTNHYPSDAEIKTMDIKINKSTYGLLEDNAVVYYCVNSTFTSFTLVARVMTSSPFSYSSSTGKVQAFSGNPRPPTLCYDSGLEGTYLTSTPFASGGSWYSWVGNTGL